MLGDPLTLQHHNRILAVGMKKKRCIDEMYGERVTDHQAHPEDGKGFVESRSALKMALYLSVLNATS